MANETNVEIMEVSDVELILSDRLDLTKINTLFNEVRNRFMYYRELFTDKTHEMMGGKSIQVIDVPYALTHRMDILVDNIMILELKSITAFENIHYKQISNYLNLTNKPIGYLINFNVDNFVMGKGYDRIKNFNYSIITLTIS